MVCMIIFTTVVIGIGRSSGARTIIFACRLDQTRRSADWVGEYSNMIQNYSDECLANMKEWIDKQNSILEKEIIEAKATEMQQEIDREILWSMLAEMGWTRANYHQRNLTTESRVKEIQDWVKAHAQGSYECYYTDFIFEDPQDAVWFELKWVR